MSYVRLNPVYHKPGDSITLDSYTASGFVTGGTLSVYLNIETPKMLDNITSFSFTSLTGGLRGIKGYLDGTSDSTNLKSTYTLSASKTGSKSIRIQIKKNSAFTNVDNNTPVCAPLTGTITLQ